VRAVVITVTVVNGPADGPGLDIALAGDFIVAAPETRSAASFGKRRLILDGGGLYFPAQPHRNCKAKELAYSGRVVDARAAIDIGLADRLAGRSSTRSGAYESLREQSLGEQCLGEQWPHGGGPGRAAQFAGWIPSQPWRS
jgi:enoyl-CoA hydratase/carnithine racemase